MVYKLGFEAYDGAITNVSTDRWEQNKYGKLGTLRGLNLLFQCFGSVLIAPLVRRFSTRTVLMTAVSLFAIIPVIIMILDASTGGRIKKYNEGRENPGKWPASALFPLHCAAGIFYGMIELIRRVIPRDIVGGDIDKLRQMDALVHIMYEVAGTAGAFMSSALATRLGDNYSILVTPIFFTCSAVIWYFLDILRGGDSDASNHAQPLFMQVMQGYSLALYAHRYLENSVFVFVAEEMFENSAYAQILLGGSNLGELCGAFLVFSMGEFVPTPIPWLRFDALLLLLIWVLPFYTFPDMDIAGKKEVQRKWAWRLATLFIPVSFGWAAGDVSLSAYIQASLTRYPKDARFSTLSAVMAFLYSTYVMVYAILSSVLGKYADSNTEPHTETNVRRTLQNIGPIQFTAIAAVLFASTFIPKGVFALNPKLLSDEDLTGNNGDEQVVEEHELQEAGQEGGQEGAAGQEGANAETPAHA
ncbi:hypothetical protein RUND412_009851 [Rhizina undulata]